MNVGQGGQDKSFLIRTPFQLEGDRQLCILVSLSLWSQQLSELHKSMKIFKEE